MGVIWVKWGYRGTEGINRSGVGYVLTGWRENYRVQLDGINASGDYSATAER